MASPRDSPRRARVLLAGAAAAALALSAVTDLRILAAAGAALALAFPRGLARRLARVARSVVPVTVGLSALSWAFLWLLRGEAPALGPFAALALRTAELAFLAFAVLERVSLLPALAPWPSATRLLVVTLGQIHALRLLVVDSLQGLRSRLVRRPRAGDVLRGAGAISATLFTLAARNARDVSDAMRARGM